MSDVLLLNSDGNPLSIIPLSAVTWQEAIKLIYQDKVTPVEFYEDWAVHSQNLAMQVPSIIMSKKYHNTATGIRFTKQNLIYRDQSRCQYCNKQFASKDLTFDHVIPKSLGGKKTWTNIVLACHHCNHSRGDDVRIQPIRKPYKPTYYELVRSRKNFPINMKHPSWQLFLNWDEKLINISGHTEERFHPEQVPGFIK
jgi:5-methylcytosine-specific restriction endonuclease McrA